MCKGVCQRGNVNEIHFSWKKIPLIWTMRPLLALLVLSSLARGSEDATCAYALHPDDNFDGVNLPTGNPASTAIAPRGLTALPSRSMLAAAPETAT
jgi:hypothetical protein